MTSKAPGLSTKIINEVKAAGLRTRIAELEEKLERTEKEMDIHIWYAQKLSRKLERIAKLATPEVSDE
jgi:predicted RNase H-like nuclease (RuvC/YqgF family)